MVNIVVMTLELGIFVNRPSLYAYNGRSTGHNGTSRKIPLPVPVIKDHWMPDLDRTSNHFILK